MKTRIFIALLTLTLASCAPAATPAPTGTALPPTAIFTPVPATIMPTFTPGFIPPPPTPLPPTPTFPPVITPNTQQVEHWREYQTELAKALFVYNSDLPQLSYGPEVSKDAICEWDILERPNQEVYLWAACISANGLSLRTNPAVIYLKLDDSIQKVNVASVKIDRPEPYLIYDLHLFPIDIQEKLCMYYFSGYMPQCHEITSAYIPLDYRQSRESVLISHLKYRRSHVEEPPLVVLSATPAP